MVEAEPSGWQRSMREAIRTLAELLQILELDPATVPGAQPQAGEFSLLVPRSFVARMRKRDPFDPLLRQILPDADSDTLHCRRGAEAETTVRRRDRPRGRSRP